MVFITNCYTNGYSYCHEKIEKKYNRAISELDKELEKIKKSSELGKEKEEDESSEKSEEESNNLTDFKQLDTDEGENIEPIIPSENGQFAVGKVGNKEEKDKDKDKDEEDGKSSRREKGRYS